MPNYVQPDYRNPSTPGVSIQIENATQPGAVLDPHHAMRSGKSGT